MAINPNLSLAVNIPQPEGPLPAFQQTMALKQMLDTSAMNKQLMAQREQEMRLREQEINENTIKAQQLKRAQDGIAAYTEAVKNNTKEMPGKGFPTDWDRVSAQMREQGFPDMADQIDQHRSEFAAKTNENIKNALAIETTKSQRVYNLFSGVSGKKPEEQGAAYTAALGQLAQLKDLPQNMVQMPQWDPSNPKTALDAVDQLRNISLSHSDKLAEVKANEESAKAAAELKKTGVETEAAQAKSDAELIASFNKDQFMQKKADDAAFRARHTGEFDTEHKSAIDYLRSTHPPSATLNQQQDYLAAFADPAKMKLLGIDPSKGHTADAAGYAKWYQETQAQKLEEEQRAKAGVGIPGTPYEKAFSPEDASSARQRKGKLEEKYEKAQTGADNLRAAIDLAKGGNKVSAQMLATMNTMFANVSEGISRINLAEIKSTSGAGNVWDNIKGWFGKAVEGNPIPANIMKDMETFEKAINGVVVKTHDRELDSIQDDTGVNYKRLGSASSGGASAASSGETVTIGGKSYKVGDTAPNGKPIVAIQGGRYATAKE